MSLFSEHLDVYSETWPTSGSMRNGTAYPRPQSAPLMAGSVSSSLLPTPSVADVTGGHKHRSGDRAGELLLPGLVLTLAKEELLPTPTSRDHKGANQRQDETCLHGALLPTPRATDGTKGGPNQRGSQGDLMLPRAVQALLPTPTTEPNTGNGHARNLGKELRVLPTPRATRGGSATESVYLLDSGGRTRRPSPDGNDSSDE